MNNTPNDLASSTDERNGLLVMLEFDDGAVQALRLEDLTLTPQEGRCYTVGGKLYGVERIIEPISAPGRATTFDNEVFELLAVLLGDERLMVTRAQNIFKEVAATGFQSGHLVYIKLRLLTESPSAGSGCILIVSTQPERKSPQTEGKPAQAEWKPIKEYVTKPGDWEL